MTLVPATSHSNAGSPAFTGWTSDGANPANVATGGGNLSGTTVANAPGLTLSGTGPKGLNLVGIATGGGLAGVFISGAGAEGIGLRGVGTGTWDFYFACAGTGRANMGGQLQIAAATHVADAVQLQQVSPLFTVASGALPTVQLVSTTGAQISGTRDVETVTPVTFNPGAATTATCLVQLSPDNVTYSTLWTETEPAGVALDGTIHGIKVRVPAGWYLKLTVNAQAVLGLTTFY